MEIHFTKHALQRMEERGISENEVYEIFTQPFLVLERQETMIIGHTSKKRFLTLVMDLHQKRLLTLWPASRKQRKLYQQRKAKGEL